MTYKPLDPIEIFAEALAVPPMLHVPPVDGVKVLTFGQFALPLAKMALRYPSTAEVRLVGCDVGVRDKRATYLTSLDDLPKGWKADAVAVVVPGDPRGVLPFIKSHMNPDAVVVVAVDQFSRGREVKDAMSQLWGQVLAYREHAPDPALFLMASDRRFGAALRPFPVNLKRLTPPYLQALFALAKDEYQLLYGQIK